jgi:hypothetical protein
VSISTFRYASITAAGPATPTLVQAHVTTTNPPGISGESGNNYQIPSLHPCGANNCLVLAFSYPESVSVSSVTSSNGNTWSSAGTLAGGTGLQDFAIYIAPGCNSGFETVTVNFSGTCQAVTFRFMEWNDIATISPANGTTGQANQTISGGSVNTGALTPLTNNDGNGGNLILSFFDCTASLSGNNVSTYTPSTGFKLIEADTSWVNGIGYPKSCAYSVQTSLGTNPITPSMAVSYTSGSPDNFNCFAIALKIASAGVGAGSTIKIKKRISSSPIIAASSTVNVKLYVPMLGNLRFIETDFRSAVELITVNSVIDSEGNTWNNLGLGTGQGQFFYWSNASPNEDLTLTINITNSGGGVQPVQFAAYDISGAATSPIGATGVRAEYSSGQVVTDTPDITPTVVGSLIFACMINGLGPTDSVTSPSGAIWENLTYTGETDSGFFNFGDGHAHYITPNTNAIAWNWHYNQTPPQNVSGCAVEFLSQ